MSPPSTKTDPPDTNAAAAEEAAKPHPLLRDERGGMNPVALLTAFRGARGERIRHTVHEGALRLPAPCLEQEEAADAWREAVRKGKKRYTLPPLETGVTRPSLSASGYVVTTVQRQETVQESVNTVDGTLQKRTLYSMVASNRIVLPERRIRGGGEGEDTVDAGEKDRDTTTAPAANTSEVAPAAASETADAMDVEKPASAEPTAEASKPAGTEEQVIPTGSNPQPAETPVMTETTKEGLAATALAAAAPAPPAAAAAATAKVEEVAPQQTAAVVAPPTNTGAGTLPTATEPAASAGSAPTVPAAKADPKPPTAAPTAAVNPPIVASNVSSSCTTERVPPAAPADFATAIAPSRTVVAPSSAPTPALQPLAQTPLATAAAVPAPAVAPTTVAAPAPGPATAAAASTTTTNPPPTATQPAPLAAAPPSSTAASAPAQPVAAPIISATTTTTTTTPQPAEPVATAAVKPAPVAASAPSSAVPVAKPVPVAASAPSSTAASSAAPASATAEETKSSAEITKRPEEDTKSAEPPKPPPEPTVLPLDQEPTPQWHQHKPGENDEMQVDPANLTPKPAWYKADSAAAIERALLPEWFDGSAAHRTPATYVQAREAVLKMAASLGHNRFITATLVRRTVPGDAGSLMRLHAFLTAHHLLNADAVNDSMPTPAAFFSTAATKKRSASLTGAMESRVLMEAVVEQANKRMKTDNDNNDDDTAIDWEAVAEQVGNGATAVDCERQFLALPLEEESEAQLQEEAAREGSITPDPTTTTVPSAAATAATKLQIHQEFLNSLIDRTDPAILRRVTEAALDTTINTNKDNDVSIASVAQAQRAAAVGLVARQTLEASQQQEAGVARLLSEIVDLRMQKLENRLAMLDDCEAMLDAERLALELERRDLYTARCRHWFGGT